MATTICLRAATTNFTHSFWIASTSTPALLSSRSICLIPLLALIPASLAYASPMAAIDSIAAINTPTTPLASDFTRVACISSPNSASRNPFVYFTPSVLRRRLFSRPGRSAFVADRSLFMRGETHATQRKFPSKKQTRGSLRTT